MDIHTRYGLVSYLTSLEQKLDQLWEPFFIEDTMFFQRQLAKITTLEQSLLLAKKLKKYIGIYEILKKTDFVNVLKEISAVLEERNDILCKLLFWPDEKIEAKNEADENKKTTHDTENLPQ